MRVSLPNLTYKLVPRGHLEDPVVHRFILVKVERLERVKQEVAHVLVHVRLDDASVKVVDDTASVHDLKQHPRRPVNKIRTSMVIKIDGYLANQVLQAVPRQSGLVQGECLR